jgi:hypothetical protein
LVLLKAVVGLPFVLLFVAVNETTGARMQGILERIFCIDLPRASGGDRGSQPVVFD